MLKLLKSLFSDMYLFFLLPLHWWKYSSVKEDFQEVVLNDVNKDDLGLANQTFYDGHGVWDGLPI